MEIILTDKTVESGLERNLTKIRVIREQGCPPEPEAVATGFLLLAPQNCANRGRQTCPTKSEQTVEQACKNGLGRGHGYAAASEARLPSNLTRHTVKLSFTANRAAEPAKRFVQKLLKPRNKPAKMRLLRIG